MVPIITIIINLCTIHTIGSGGLWFSTSTYYCGCCSDQSNPNRLLSLTRHKRLAGGSKMKMRGMAHQVLNCAHDIQAKVCKLHACLERGVNLPLRLLLHLPMMLLCCQQPGLALTSPSLHESHQRQSVAGALLCNPNRAACHDHQHCGRCWAFQARNLPALQHQ